MIDLNSDLGESFGAWQLGDDAAMLDIVTSANVACGFHAGDPSTLRATCGAAAARGVRIGAQVAYPDLLGFGRRFIDMEPAELQDAVLYQIGGLDAFARTAGAPVAYVKPHGALYHAAAGDPAVAAAVVAAAREYDHDLAILGQPGSQLLRAADDAGLRSVGEAFADRAYEPDGGLVSRRVSGAVLTDPEVIAERVVRLANESVIEAVDGSTVRIDAESLCVHGDTPGAVDIAGAVRRALVGAGVDIRAFA
ncbi:MAG: 5-oxoprolinase subunit PxpA [Actinomycetota bacterium]